MTTDAVQDQQHTARERNLNWRMAVKPFPEKLMTTNANRQISSLEHPVYYDQRKNKS